MQTYPLLILLVVLALACAVSHASERQIVLRDYINQAWTQELVTYSFSAKEGECRVDSVVLAGPNGPIPVQLSAVEYWPKSQYVKSAQLSFIADLAPTATNTYTVRCGKRATGEKVPATDLAIMKLPDAVELRTSKFGVRMPLGEKIFPQPMAASDVPGPVQAMYLGNASFSGSRLFGAKKIAGYTSTLTTAGPVFGEVAIRYTYEDGATLDITAQLAAGDSQVLWATKVSGDAPDDGWQLVLFRPGEQMRLPWTGEFGNNKWGKLNEQVDVAMEQQPVGDITKLTPWGDWWDGSSQTEWTFKVANGAEVLKAASRDADAWVEPMAPSTLRDWGGWQKKLLPLRKEANGEIVLHVNNASGERKWSLGGAQPGTGHRLNIVNDYVLEWPGDEGKHPRMFLSKAELEKMQARGPADPKLLAELKPYWITEPRPVPSYHDSNALGAYLLTGDPNIARDAKVVERLRRSLDLLGKFDTMRSTCLVAAYYDALIDSPLLADEERKILRAKMAYLGYVLSDPSTWSAERGYRSYNLNMSVAHILNVGMIATAIPEHPMVKQWMKVPQAMMESFLNEVGPEGEWGESITKSPRSMPGSVTS